MGHNNAINAFQEGVQYLSSTGSWTGLDGVSSGYVLTSNGANVAPSWQPAPAASNPAYFSAFLSTSPSDVTGDGTAYTIVCDQVNINVGSGYDNTTGIFTAPTLGLYVFTANVYTNGTYANNTVIDCVFVSTVGSPPITYSKPTNIASSGGDYAICGSTMLWLSAGQTVYLALAVEGNATKNINVYGSDEVGNYGTAFSGSFLGS